MGRKPMAEELRASIEQDRKDGLTIHEIAQKRSVSKTTVNSVVPGRRSKRLRVDRKQRRVKSKRQSMAFIKVSKGFSLRI